jgi:hypothetical protein
MLQDGTHHVGVYQVCKDATPASAGATQDVIAEAALQQVRPGDAVARTTDSAALDFSFLAKGYRRNCFRRGANFSIASAVSMRRASNAPASTPWVNCARWTMLGGVVLFSGSLYAST